MGLRAHITTWEEPVFIQEGLTQLGSDIIKASQVSPNVVVSPVTEEIGRAHV